MFPAYRCQLSYTAAVSSTHLYNGNSTVVVARQETADLLNEYFRENTGPVDASQLNIAGDDGLFDLSGLTASDPSVQFMGTPVSYTHLDVYKRQAQKRQGPRVLRLQQLPHLQLYDMG